jgi:hypothetical protein
MHQRHARASRLHPRLQSAEAAADAALLRLQQADAVRREAADHQADRRLVEIFLRRRRCGLAGDADADRADPLLQPGAQPQLIDDRGQVLRQVIGDIDET